MSEKERLEIVNWVCDHFSKFKLISFKHPGLLDYTLSILDNTTPLTIWKIKKRIIERENLQNYAHEPFQKDIIMMILPGGRLHKHTDPNIGDFIHTRFNAFIQLPTKGIKTFYSENKIGSRERHYTMCRSGLDLHWTEKNDENRARITLSFGYLLPRKVIDVTYFNIGKTIPFQESYHPSEVQLSKYLFENMVPIAFFYIFHGHIYTFIDRYKDVHI